MGYKSDISKADRGQESIGFPEVILIDNCNACNLECSMCDHPNMHKYRKTMVMDRKLYEKIIDEVAEENPDARVWEIFFGEPCICNDMHERIAYAKEKGLKDVVLNSNGLLLDEKRSREFVSAGLDGMYVGIDAATDETYRKIRVGGDIETAKKNVLKYRDVLKELGKPGQKLFVQFVVSDENEDEVEAFRAFWQAEGVNVKIRPRVSWAGLVAAKNLSDNDPGRRPCYWLMRGINICADGKVALCAVDVHCRVDNGDVSMSTIKEIWNGQLKKFRDMHRDKRFEGLPEMCVSCRDWQSAYAEYVYTE